MATFINHLNRRQFNIAASLVLLSLPASRALAHHGWSSFDGATPLYLEGRVKTVRWQNPHAELELDALKLSALPADLSSRKIPTQQAAVDAAEVLKKTQLAKHSGLWEVELAPLTRMSAWQVEPLAVGSSVAVVGFSFPDQKPDSKGVHVLRVEFLFVGGKTYALRSAPVAS